MAKVVVIKGNPNAGKTTASRFILQVLLYKGARLVSYTALNGLNNLKGDFVAVIEYQKKENCNMFSWRLAEMCYR